MNAVKWMIRLVLGAALAGGSWLRAAPAPLVTFYGMISDEFGWPYSGGVNITVSANGLIVLNKNVQTAVGRNYNYIFRMPYDTGVVEYSLSSVTLGDTIEVVVTALATSTVLVDKTLTVNFPPGVVINLNLAGGTDSLGDGLPDALRYWIWQTLGLPGPYNATNITASMDSDGDGVSNLNEFLAGTDPANATDYLKLAIAKGPAFAMTQVCSNVSQLSWFSVPGKAYQLEVATSQNGHTVWNPLFFASSLPGETTNSYTIGVGNITTVFVPSCATNEIYRLEVQSPPLGAFLIP